MSQLTPARFPADPLPGLDVLRLAAAGLVTLQHAFTLTNHEELTRLGLVNIGQLGVALFLGVSARLGTVSQRPPLDWLFQRLRRVYPAFWMALSGSFVMTWLTSYKSFTAAQVASQLLGTGYFTHPTNLVNVPTWFLSLLFVCYVGLFLSKASGRPLELQALLVGGFLVGSALNGYSMAWMHLVTFFAVSVIFLVAEPMPRMLGLIAGGGGLLALSLVARTFAYPGIVFLLLAASGLWSSLPRTLRVAADYSYEYYLIHGVCLVAALSVFKTMPVAGVAFGVLVAALGAAPLRRVAEFAFRQPVR